MRKYTKKELDFDYSACFPFWVDLTPPQRRDVAETMLWGRYVAPETINIPVTDNLWAVARGQVCVVMYAEEGKQIELLQMNEGEVGFSLSALVRGASSYFIEAMAVRDTDICILPEKVGNTWLSSLKSVRDCQTQALSVAMSKLANMVAQLAFDSLRERLQKRLIEYSTERSSKTIFVTHEELANALGTSREVVSRILKQLSDEGALDLNRKRITMLQ
ncbi:MAG: Crp/Fnr family transcriptional regulator [Clostridia bacterium]